MNIARTLTYLGAIYFFNPGPFDYVEPVGGFVNNDETEYDAIIWNDARPKPAWSTVQSEWNNGNVNRWEIDQSVYGNWYNVKDDAAQAKADVATAQSDISTLQSEVGAIEGDVSTLQSSVTTINSDMSEMSGDMAALASTVSTLGAAGAHINDGATDAATNAPTNLSGLLIATLTGELNSANTKQNALAAKYNDLSGKFNTLLDRLEAKGLLATS